MKIFFKISLGVLGAVALSIILLTVYAARGLPAWVIVASVDPHESNIFYLNNQQLGTVNGFCAKHKATYGDWEISLVRDDKEQKIYIKDTTRLKIGEPIGDELGLVVFQANARQDLWEKFGCKM